MTSPRRRRAAAWVVLLFVASLPIVTRSTASASQTTHVHIAGTLGGTGTPDAGCNGFRYTTAGRLEGVPLGSVLWSGMECVDVLSSAGGITISGAFALDDGLLMGSYEGHAGLPDATGRVYGWGRFTMTGESGVYAGAVGSGTFTVIAQPLAGTADFELIGTLERSTCGDTPSAPPNVRARRNCPPGTSD